MLNLAGPIYRGATHTRLSQLHSQRGGIDLSRTTQLRILICADPNRHKSVNGTAQVVHSISI